MKINVKNISIMEHKELNIDPKQRSNLKKLADYLLSGNLKAEFDMGMFSDRGSHSISCGTVGCAVGHGPYAGIPKDANETWYDYARIVFNGYDINLFDWLFGGEWYHYDNTPEGAGKRILYALKYGVPTNHKYDTKIYKS